MPSQRGLGSGVRGQDAEIDRSLPRQEVEERGNLLTHTRSDAIHKGGSPCIASIRFALDAACRSASLNGEPEAKAVGPLTPHP